MRVAEVAEDRGRNDAVARRDDDERIVIEQPGNAERFEGGEAGPSGWVVRAHVRVVRAERGGDLLVPVADEADDRPRAEAPERVHGVACQRRSADELDALGIAAEPRALAGREHDQHDRVAGDPSSERHARWVQDLVRAQLGRVAQPERCRRSCVVHAANLPNPGADRRPRARMPPAATAYSFPAGVSGRVDPLWAGAGGPCSAGWFHVQLRHCWLRPGAGLELGHGAPRPEGRAACPAAKD